MRQRVGGLGDRQRLRLCLLRPSGSMRRRPMLHDLPPSMIAAPVLRTGVKKRVNNNYGLYWSYFIPEMTTKRQSTWSVSYAYNRATRGVRRKSGEIADISLVIMTEDARYGACRDELDQAVDRVFLQTYHTQ